MHPVGPLLHHQGPALPTMERLTNSLKDPSLPLLDLQVGVSQERMLVRV